jgi:hypothetical protein
LRVDAATLITEIDLFWPVSRGEIVRRFPHLINDRFDVPVVESAKSVQDMRDVNVPLSRFDFQDGMPFLIDLDLSAPLALQPEPIRSRVFIPP